MEDDILMEGKIHKPEAELVWCDYDECPEHGEYIRCYFDTSKRCQRYIDYIERLVHGELDDE